MLDAHSSRAAHFLQNAALILLSLILLPLDTFILFSSYALQSLLHENINRRRRRIRRSRTFYPKTILVTGVGMAKGLSLARAFYQAGHRVIGADFEPYGVPVNGRFSVVLSKFYPLSRPNSKEGATHYIQDLLSAVRREKVDLWVSCSGVASAVEDGQAKEVIERHTPCKAIQFDTKTTATLHEKHSFIQHTKRLALPAPETYGVTSRSAVHNILNNADDKLYVLKSVGVDDASRGDLTLLPRPTLSETYEHVADITISNDKPWVLQQFIPGEEYCTHALVVDGDVKVFVACPSSELLMHYEALHPRSALSKAMLKFTQEFAARSGDGMTGHLSFDFLVEESASEKGLEKVLYPIECNPRAHTAVVLFEQHATQMTHGYLTALAPEMNGAAVNGVKEHIVVPTHPAKYYWIGHDLVSLVLLPLLGIFVLSPGSIRDFFEGCYLFVQHLLFWKDGTYEIWDPLPWWWLYHVYWPGQFLACILQRRKWSRVNVSTTKMFNC